MNKYTTEQLLDMVLEVNSWDNSLESFEYWENEEEFFQTFFEGRPEEVARAIHFGDYNYMHDYVRFNTYGNLESLSSYDLDEDLKDSESEIVERAKELHESGELDLAHLLYADEEEEEE